MLAQIEPRALDNGLRARALIGRRQTIAKGFLGEGRRGRAEKTKERDDAVQHLAAKRTLVRSELQALGRGEDCVENAVDDQANNERDQDNDDRRN